MRVPQGRHSCVGVVPEETRSSLLTFPSTDVLGYLDFVALRLRRRQHNHMD
jgi:hypothetical protein